MASVDTAIVKLMSIFDDRPLIEDEMPDVEWVSRNAFVAWISEGGRAVQKLRVKASFLDREYPVLINLARFWAEMIFEGKYEQKIKEVGDDELRELVESAQADLEDEKKRIAPVWDETDYFFRELYPHGDTGEWYQIVFRSLANLNDEGLRENIGKIFELISPLAQTELESRESVKRNQAYEKYQIMTLENDLAQALDQAKYNFDTQVRDNRKKWADALSATKQQLLDLEMENRRGIVPAMTYSQSTRRQPLSYSLRSLLGKY